VAVLGLGYLWAARHWHEPPSAGRRRRRHTIAFFAGLGALWLASDWPVHDLAEGYLYSAHMIQHLLFTLVVAPLVLLGTPAGLARRLVATRPRLLKALRWIGRPFPGLLQFNLVLVLSHWPLVVDITLRHHGVHFVAHAVLLVSAVLMWLPVVSPLPEIPRARPPTQMLYLFLQTIVPTVPASFLTFGATPLYHFYEHVPRLWGVSALSDQQVAGLIMKIIGGAYLWVVIAVIFFRWSSREEADEALLAKARRAKTQGEDVLLWEEVEAELRQLEH